MFRRVTVGGLLLCMATAVLPGSTAAGDDSQAHVVALAERQIGKKFRMGTEGPATFDCSGLIYYVYKNAGLYDRFGSKRIQARNYYKWGQARGLLSKSDPEVGDLILWTEHGRIAHMGMFIGFDARGRELAISALTTGVMRHKIHTISVKFLTYVHTGLGSEPDPSESPSPTPSTSPTTSTSPSPTTAPSPTTVPSPTTTPSHSPTVAPTLGPSVRPR